MSNYDSTYFKDRDIVTQKDEILAVQVLEKTIPKSILDFGAGAGKYVKIFTDYGVPTIGYEPNIEQIQKIACSRNNIFKEIPSGTYDLIWVCDVLEHVTEAEIDDVLRAIQKKAGKYIIFSICDSSLWGKYPDETHVTCKSRIWWENKIAEYFTINRVPDDWIFKEQLFLCMTR